MEPGSNAGRDRVQRLPKPRLPRGFEGGQGHSCEGQTLSWLQGPAASAHCSAFGQKSVRQEPFRSVVCFFFLRYAATEY